MDDLNLLVIDCLPTDQRHQYRASLLKYNASYLYQLGNKFRSIGNYEISK